MITRSADSCGRMCVDEALPERAISFDVHKTSQSVHHATVYIGKSGTEAPRGGISRLTRIFAESILPATSNWHGQQRPLDDWDIQPIEIFVAWSLDGANVIEGRAIAF
jgi:hypothetical protein